jgi:hypothetical protein
MKKFFKENSLSLVMFAIFLLFLTGQLLAGHLVYNKELITHGSSIINLTQYLSSGHFIESLFENWESEGVGYLKSINTL